MSDSSRYKIYIVDDDPFFIELLSTILEDEGHTVGSNVAAAYALSEVRRQRPDCILVDLQMAEMNGLELCEALRQMPETAKSAIVVVSAHSDPIWQNRARTIGANGFLVKPVDGAELLAAVDRAIAEMRAG